MFQLDAFTIISCALIALAFYLAWSYINKTDKWQFANRKKWIEQLPSLISHLGVLGTFLGITKGLMSFDTSDLDKSIPLLLDGLKTAFFTSLFGMIGSLILNRVVSHKFDVEDKESEMMKAAKMIVDTLKTNQNNLPKILNNCNKDLARVLDDNETSKVIRCDLEQLKDDIEELKGHIEEMQDINAQVAQALDSIKTATATTADELPRLRAVAVTATASVSAIDNNVEEINGAISNIKAATSEINESVETIKAEREEDY